jgi:hypothetical protein
MTKQTNTQSSNIPDHLEEISNRPMDAERALSDEELAAGGVVPVKAYMRTKASKNALRQKKAKAKALNSDTPRKQLNLMAPADDAARAALKAVAEKMSDGQITAADIDKIDNPDVIRLGSNAMKVLENGGLKATILRRILG